MKLLHTSDWHLGRVLHEHPLLDAQREVLGRLIARLADDPHDALVVAGDVFDRSVPSEDAVQLFSRFLRDLRAACPRLPVILIAGNHDSGTRLAFGAEILELGNVHVRGTTDKLGDPVRVETAGGAAQVWPVPFLWPGSLLAHAEGEDVPLGTQAAALSEALARIRALRDPGLLQVAVAHCFVAGGATSDSERVLVGQATQVDPGLFEGFDYAALGHLHRGQRAGGNAWYSGSPLKYSFSEASDSKAVLSVEVRRGAEPVVTAVPIEPPRDLAILRGELRDLLENPAHLAQADKLLRIELTDAVAASQPFALLKTRFPYLLDFRMPEPGGPRDGAGEVGAPAPLRDRADIEQDFREFELRLRAEPPGDDLLARFRELRQRAEREASA